MATNPIACRLACYRPFEQIALRHIASLGLRHVELALPPTDRIDGVLGELQRCGLTTTSVQLDLGLASAEGSARLPKLLTDFERFGCKLLLSAGRIDDAPLAVAHERLRLAAELAAGIGATIVLETHPPLATNADAALATLAAIDHPSLKLNFDPANLYYHNRGLDPVAELRRLAPHVAAVHLKDTPGEFGKWNFPALGEGVVPFDDLFGVLDEADFRGPYTIEIQGVDGEQKSEALVRERVETSVQFLRNRSRL